MLLNLRSSVNWRLNAFACLCGVSLFFLSSSASAQDTTAYYEVGASEGVWVESEWDDNSPAAPAHETELAYEAEGSEMPAYDPATALQQDAPPIEMPYETYDDTSDSWTETSAAGYTVVKNKDFFGVDKDACCDEWSKMCKMKDMKYNCGCGGLKAKKGHLGIPWLRTADAGEDCDYCQGGCCEKGRSARRQSRKTSGNVFTNAWSKALRGRGEDCTESTCPEEEGCSSCQ